MSFVEWFTIGLIIFNLITSLTGHNLYWLAVFGWIMSGWLYLHYVVHLI